MALPDSILDIPNYALAYCNAATIQLPSNLKTMGMGAFRDCPLLTEIIIPDTVTSVADYAFQGCTGLTDVTLSDNMTDVSAKLFSNLDKQLIDMSSMTIRVKASLVSYVQNIYPTANVVGK